MAIRRFVQASPMSGSKSFKIWDQSTYVSRPGFELIARATVGSGGAATINFDGIPQNYQSLQLRGIIRSTAAAANDYMRLRFNGDTGTNYASHYLRGDGSAASAGAYTAITGIYIDPLAAASQTSGIFGVAVIDILDYATSGQKNKTTRLLGGYDANGSGYSNLYSGLWISTNAVTSISLAFNTGSIAQYSNVGLYGVK